MRARAGPAALAAPATKSHWAYEALRALILDGSLAAGEVLDQQALAASLGISTTPLREAIRRLEAEEFVITRDHRDVRVAPLLLGDLEQIYAVRLELDPLAAKLACGRASDQELEQAGALLPPNDPSMSRLVSLRANREFHRAIYATSGNDVLTRVLDGLWDRCDGFRAGILASPETAREAWHDHARMSQLFSERASDQLAALMREHLEQSLDTCRRLLRAQATQPTPGAPEPIDPPFVMREEQA